MEISLINPAWHDRYLEQIEKTNLSEESVKELYNSRNGSESDQDFITAGKTAIVPILGPLTKTRDFFYSLFSSNHTTYDGIIKAVQAADSNDDIEEIRLKIDSPGGNWIGLTEVVQALAAAKKPIVAEVTGMATSAAYIIAAQADRIESTTDSNDVGGLGVQTRAYDDSKYSKTVRSSNAPKKNPDAFTKSGEKELIKQLDAVEEKAIKMVSEGRSAATGKNISEKVVKKDFGRGASLLADEALGLNMIDEIKEAPARISNSKPAATSGKGRKLESVQDSDIKPNKRKFMDLKELRAEYPQLCADLVEEGRTLERDQVKGHIILGESSGAIELCLKNLKDGKEFGSAEVQAGYMAAGMTKKDLESREEDNPEGDLKPEGDTELSEEAKEKALIDKAMGLSNKPATVEA